MLLGWDGARWHLQAWVWDTTGHQQPPWGLTAAQKDVGSCQAASILENRMLKSFSSCEQELLTGISSCWRLGAGDGMV